jgi:hypothetical protein
MPTNEPNGVNGLVQDPTVAGSLIKHAGRSEIALAQALKQAAPGLTSFRTRRSELHAAFTLVTAVLMPGQSMRL